MHFKSVLVTGGCGFIGARLAQSLAAAVDSLVIVDNLHPQVHGPAAQPPSLPDNASVIVGDVADPELLKAVIQKHRPQLVFHLAAETGTGQSTDLPTRYCQTNIIGTTLLLEALVASGHGCRVVLASSRAVYGEGRYLNSAGKVRSAEPRTAQAMARQEFMPKATGESGPIQPVPTTEDTPPAPASVYASTKLMQELLLTQVTAANPQIEPVILRFQNVFGDGQSLRNPYTGVLSIFVNQIFNGKTLNIYEDGEIVRDFVYVQDVVNALIRAASSDSVVGEIINIGSGSPTTILEAGAAIIRHLAPGEERLAISGDFRTGDVRYAVADIARARTLLNWTPEYTFAEGLERLIRWSREDPDHNV